MPRTASVTRQNILYAAYMLFRRKGFTRVGMDEIASAAKVTKRTLYYHFRSKDALLADVLQSQHELALAAFQTFAYRLSGKPRQLIENMFSELARWSAKPRWAGSGFTRLVMELADLPGHPARAIARRHKAMLESHLAKRLAQARIAASRRRAREIWLLAEGAMALILIHGDTSYARTASDAAKRLIESKPRGSK